MSRSSLLLIPGAALALLSTEALGQFLGGTAESSNQQAAGATLPPDFRGRITYQGNFSGRRSEPGRAPRRLDVRSIVNSGGRTIEFAGPVTIDVEYDRNTVRATYTADGVRSGFTGTRSGSNCRVIDTGDGGIGTVRCDRNSFSGTFDSAPGARATYRTTVDAQATRFVDAVDEERQRQVATAAAGAERQGREADHRRQAETEAARMRAAPRATPAQAALVGRAVHQDSTNWIVNRYDAGSLVDVRVLERNGAISVLRGNYTYNGGTRGWVEARASARRVECLRYHDRSSCEPARPPRSATQTASESGEIFRRLSDCVLITQNENYERIRSTVSPSGAYVPGYNRNYTERWIVNRCSEARLIEVSRIGDTRLEHFSLSRGDIMRHQEFLQYRDAGPAR